MVMRLFLLIGIIIICFGCKTEKPSGIQEEMNIKRIDSLSKEKIKTELLKLSPESEKDLEIFEDFQNLRNIMVTMHKANPYYVCKYADSTNFLIDSFEENLSEDLNVNPINSRITVLSTESGLLMQLSEKKTPIPEEVLKANTRLIKAYNSLIIQLNELSLAIPENIEKELLKDLEEDEKL